MYKKESISTVKFTKLLTFIVVEILKIEINAT